MKRPTSMSRTLGGLLVLGFVVLVQVPAARVAQALDIQEVRSPGGVAAWLVEDHSIPLITMRFSFEGGWANEPVGKQGLTHFLAGMLDEGAGERPSLQFQKRQRQLAMKLSFQASADRFYGTFQALTRHRDDSVALFSDAVNAPRFDEEPFRRVRRQIILSIDSNAQDPDHIASDNWLKLMFAGHPYGRTKRGTTESLNELTPDDLRDLTGRLFAKTGLKIAVVGDINRAELGRLLDRVFGKLPTKSGIAEIAEAKVDAKSAVQIIDHDIPQSIIRFGHSGIKRTDEDFVPAYVLNHILGVGSGSRLTEEIREKRGLTYSVYSYLSSYDHGALFSGSASTKNGRAGETVDLIRREIARMAETGPTKRELEEAKTYMTGSYALRFDTSSKIAGQLLAIQIDDLGIDYVEKRNEMIDAVRLEDVRRIAGQLLKPERLVMTIVGKPQGVKPTKDREG